jgi:hypothetical protein
MATAIPITTPKTGNTSNTQLHILAENALSMALYHLRHPASNGQNLHAATAKANRALTLLKWATESNSLTVGA